MYSGFSPLGLGPAGTSQHPEKRPGITGGLRSHLGAGLGALAL